MMNGFSVIIPVYKDLEGLQKTAYSLQKSVESLSLTYETIVCNDGADPKISAFCLKQGFKEVKLKQRKGSYYARNRGIQKAKYNHFLFADADITVLTGWFDYIKNHIENHPYIAFKISMDINENMSLFKRYSVIKEFQTDQYFENNHFGPTAFLWVAKSTFEKVGLFDESLFSGGDLEFGKRVYEANVNQHYVRKKFVLHPPRSFTQTFTKRIRVLQGLKILEQRKTVQFHDHFSFSVLLRLPFRMAHRLLRSLQESSNSQFSRAAIFYAESAHHIINFCAFALVLLGLGKSKETNESLIPSLSSIE